LNIKICPKDEPLLSAPPDKVKIDAGSASMVFFEHAQRTSVTRGVKDGSATSARVTIAGVQEPLWLRMRERVQAQSRLV
jgi:hypothetical protein